MDPEFVEYVQEMIPVYQNVRIISYVQLGVFTALFYHYATTFHEEVSQVWPQKSWKIGKVLFLTTRYSAIAAMAMEINVNWPTFAITGVPACEALLRTTNIARIFAGTCAEATIWLCLYALLGGKPKYTPLLVLLFLGVMVPLVVLQSIALWSQHAIDLGELDLALGYACTYTPPIHRDLRKIAAYIGFSRTLVTMAIGLITILVRYKRQRHSLIQVIRREGGMYFMSALVLRFFGGLGQTTSVNLNDKYLIIDALMWLCVNVFADRLLLLIRKVDDPGTQNVVSTLMFNPYDVDSSRSSGLGEYDPTDEDMIVTHAVKEKEEGVEPRDAASPSQEASPA